ncbi:MAG: family metal transporter [Bacteroidetes bacterium]|nr:family metal transporter [Bacteroidota bacterium]MBP1678027.1 family metal transporter [Bacteroidota bacterium]
MITWIYVIGATLLVSIVSVVGIVFLSWNKDRLQKIIFILVSLAVGALFGDAFLHLIPESIELHTNPHTTGILVIVGILFFFTLEKFLLWRHDHRVSSPENDIKPLGYMSLMADGFHNLIDGVLIGASFMVSPELGFTTTVAIVLHEIPQEIGDFGVLTHSGFSVRKAIWLNLVTALTAVLGAVLVLLLGSQIENIINYIVPIAAGGFIYLAGSDLIPELKKENSIGKSLLQFLCILSGLGLILLFHFMSHSHH